MKRSRSIQLSIVTSVAAILLSGARDLTADNCRDPKVRGRNCGSAHGVVSGSRGGGRQSTKTTVRGAIGKSAAKMSGGGHSAGG